MGFIVYRFKPSKNIEPSQKHKPKLKIFLFETIGITDQPQDKECNPVNEELKDHQNHYWRYTGEEGENIISLDLRKINEAVADFFIVCEASNQPQIRAIADNVEYRVKEVCDENPYHHEGHQALQWVLIDYVNVVVHIMQPDTRKFYKLEEMWSDAAAAEHDE